MTHARRALLAVGIALLSALFFTATYVLNRAAAVDGGHWAWTAALRYLCTLPLLLLSMPWLGGIVFLLSVEPQAATEANATNPSSAQRAPSRDNVVMALTYHAATNSRTSRGATRERLEQEHSVSADTAKTQSALPITRSCYEWCAGNHHDHVLLPSHVHQQEGRAVQ